MKNEILSEVWRNRDEVVKSYDYNLDVMVKALQDMERQPLNPIVNRGKEILNKEKEEMGEKYGVNYKQAGRE